ncbi:hypothetical protein J2045_001416 [Peteryoungia aggregata LMG 23059]|uniref:Uncharacterized protein n=1 Tax=Peteryoungia aggregata LMG 23059 TaxID=1368425 RepID=A0ABU0G6U0_9HYPH|nr:hypothetical protein [Peteryoungia aggregata]MDQ0420397.1 hypothetical protein [Peteryoungia aggregata LMG 23059]
MLPPVRASASQYATAVDVRMRPDDAGAPQLPASPMPAASATTGQNAAIAGQLNMMLLSGPERMSQNLGALAEVLGTALRIEPRLNETPGDYMARLIEGIATLPAVDRLKLQKLLMQSFAGLQLRTLLEAMANPAGPERATLALYLELYRQKDSDGVTRAVISSYRELGEETRANAAAPLVRAAANDGARPASVMTRQEPAQPLAPPSRMSPTEGAGDAELSSTGPATAKRAVSDTIRPNSPAASVAEGQRPGGEMPLASLVSRARSADNLQRPTTSDLGSVTDDLRAAAAPSAVRGAVSDRLSATDPLAIGRDLPMANRSDRPSSGIEERGPLAPALVGPPLLPGNKSPQALPATWLAELLETALVKTLLQWKTIAVDPKPSLTPDDTVARFGPDPVSSDQPETPGANAPPEQSEDAAPALDAAVIRNAAEERTSPIGTVLVEQTLIRPLVPREGMPVPFVSYLIDDDVTADRVEEKDDEDEDGRRNLQGEDRDEANDPAGDEGQGAKENEAEPGATTTGSDSTIDRLLADGAPGLLALPLSSPEPLPRPNEPAHELYLRMAGLV